jgi:hypothetical protein
MVLGGWETEAIFAVCLGKEEKPQFRIKKNCDENQYDWEGLCVVLAKLVPCGSVCPAPSARSGSEVGGKREDYCLAAGKGR